MDPVARRYMWDVISRITTLRKQSSVILTTHSMVNYNKNINNIYI